VKSVVRFAPRLPCQRFLHWPDQCLRAHRNFLSLPRDQKLATAFPSPVTGSPFGVPIPGSTFPACCFVAYAVSPQPVRPFAPRLKPGSPRLRLHHHVGPSLVPDNVPRALSRSPLPRLDLSIHPRSRRSTALVTRESTFPKRPMAARSPSSLLSLVSKTDRSSWLATSPEAGCFSNLLEPSSLCA